MNLLLGKKIKEIRRAMGLNQAQMAKELGVHFQTVSRYERGLLEPGPEILSVLADKFYIEGQELSRSTQKQAGAIRLSLGQKIRELRKSRGINQTQMAEELGVHYQTISRYERGLIDPGPEILSVLAYKFHVDANFLLGGQEHSRILPTGADVISLEHRLGKSLPKIHTKEKAIARVIRILENMSEARVREVLEYAEEKNELVMLQSISRLNRNDPVPDLRPKKK